jgi:hypothetical protein
VVSGVIDTADHQNIDFIVEYLREFEAICKKALAHGSGAHIELFDEKNGGRKSRDRVPLRKSEDATDWKWIPWRYSKIIKESSSPTMGLPLSSVALYLRD